MPRKPSTRPAQDCEAKSIPRENVPRIPISAIPLKWLLPVIDIGMPDWPVDSLLVLTFQTFCSPVTNVKSEKLLSVLAFGTMRSDQTPRTRRAGNPKRALFDTCTKTVPQSLPHLLQPWLAIRDYPSSGNPAQSGGASMPVFAGTWVLCGTGSPSALGAPELSLKHTYMQKEGC